jgi:hypothetical protein
MPNAAKIYIPAVIGAGLAIAIYAVLHWEAASPISFSVFLALFVGAALLKGRIPGITGTYSPVFFFVLLGSHLLSFSEIIFAAALAGIVQCTFFVLRNPSPIQVAFNASNMIISTALAFAVIHREVPGLSDQPLMMLLMLGSSVYYVVNTVMVSIVVTLVDGKPLSQVWRHWCLRSLPYYLFGAVIAGATVSVQDRASMLVVGMACPSVLLMTVYYRYWLKSLTQVNTLVR